MTRRDLLVALLLLGVPAVGCGEGGGNSIEVRGAISYQGRPISSGLINFTAEKGKPLGGALQTDGTYEFRLPAGEYRVAIRESPDLPEGWKEGDPMPAPRKDALPPRYGRPDTSGLTLTVSEGDSPLVKDFTLE